MQYKIDNPNIDPIPAWINKARQPRTFKRYINVWTSNRKKLLDYSKSIKFFTFILTSPNVIQHAHNFLKLQRDLNIDVLIKAGLNAEFLRQWGPVVSLNYLFHKYLVKISHSVLSRWYTIEGCIIPQFFFTPLKFLSFPFKFLLSLLKYQIMSFMTVLRFWDQCCFQTWNSAVLIVACCWGWGDTTGAAWMVGAGFGCS